MDVKIITIEDFELFKAEFFTKFEKMATELKELSNNIDLVCINNYGNRPDKLIVEKRNDNLGNDNNGFYSGEQSLAYNFHRLFEAYQKPVYMTESGTESDHRICSNYMGHFVDNMRYGFMGLAGFNTWVGWLSNEKQYLASTIRTQYHMNGDDVINTLSNNNGQWLQGREVKEGTIFNDNDFLAEQQYYLSHHQERCVGYVYNRTYNIHNNGCYTISFPTGRFYDFHTLEWNHKKMKIQELKKNTDYTIHWYSYKNGDYMSSQCINTTSNGEMDLEHPDLDDLNPLLWYVVEQRNCQGHRNVSVEGEVESEQENILITPERSNIEVSPNPFNTSINVNAGEEIGKVIIQDLNGKTVKIEYFNSKLASINTETLRSGVYFLYAEKWNYIYKIVKL